MMRSVGKLLLLPILLGALVSHISDLPGTITMVSSKMAACGLTALLKEHLPGTPIAQLVTIMVYGALSIGASAAALLILGANSLGATLYLIFLACVTPIIHWPISAKTGNVKNEEVVQILKNVAIAGGLILVIFGGRGGAKAKTN